MCILPNYVATPPRQACALSSSATKTAINANKISIRQPIKL